MNSVYNKRLHAIDNLRSFLALLGFPLHAVLFLGGGLYPHPMVLHESMAQYANSLPSVAKNYFLSLYYVHTFRMPLFFLLAGFFAHYFYRSRGGKKFIMERLYKIGLPFLFCQMWALPFYMIFFTTNHFFPYIYSDFIQNLIHQLYINEGSWWGRVYSLNFDWFLYFLLLFYVITFFILKLKTHFIFFDSFFKKLDGIIFVILSSRWRYVWIGLLCSMLLCREANLGEMPHRIDLVSSLNEIGAYAVWYGLGWWLWSYQDKFSIFFNYGGFKFLVSIMLYGTFLYWYFGHANQDSFYNHSISILLYQFSTSFSVLALFGVAWRFLTRPNRIFRYISKTSYWLYLVQIPMIISIIPMFLSINHDYVKHENFIILSVEVSILSLLIALLSYELLVRRTWLNSIFGGKTQY